MLHRGFCLHRHILKNSRECAREMRIHTHANTMTAWYDHTVVIAASGALARACAGEPCEGLVPSWGPWDAPETALGVVASTASAAFSEGLAVWG